MKFTAQNLIPLSVPLLVFLGLITSTVWAIVSATGQMTYPLDDPYIHLAMARHFTESASFGVSLAGFSASSSSPAWTLLVSMGYGVLGANDWLPLGLNLLAGVALIALLFHHTTRITSSPWLASLFTTLVILVMPLPSLVLLGMEHSLHGLVILALLIVSLRAFDPEAAPPSLFAIGFLSTLAMALRYESGFLLAPVVLMLLLHRHWRIAAVISICGALPIVGMGLVQLANGWFFFPSSILHKSVLSQTSATLFDQIGNRIYGQLFGNPHLSVLWITSAVLLWTSLTRQASLSQTSALRMAFLAGTLAHVALASTGSFSRYEAYLVLIGFACLAPALPHAREGIVILFARPWPHRIVPALLALATLLVLAFAYQPQFRALNRIAPGATNVYDQQIQMARFLDRNYSGRTIVANDIGAINYYADIRCLDLAALGSVEPTKAVFAGRWDDRFIEQWALQEQASIAVIYEAWWRDKIPESWIKIAEWTLDERVSAAQATVAWYAITPAEAAPLYENLRAFEAELPDRVTSTLAARR